MSTTGSVLSEQVEKEKEDEIKIEKYSINGGWMRDTLEERENLPFISNATTQMEFESQIAKLQKWKKANPEASVNFWYDRETVTKEQIEATQKLLDEKAKEDPSFNIQLKDVRDIPMVKENPDSFSTSVTGYQKLDTRKPLICMDEIEKGNDSAIWVDLDASAMDKQALFDPLVEDRFREKDPHKTFKKSFQTYGYMQNLNMESGIENQFIQVLNKPQTLQALKIYINHVLTCTVNALNLEWEIPNEDNEANKEKTLTDLNAFTFEKQSLLFSMILSWPKIQVKDPKSGEWRNFDPEIDTNIFGNFHDRDACRNMMLNASKGVNTEEMLPLFSVEGNTVKSRDDIKSIGNSVKFSNYYLNPKNYNAVSIIRYVNIRTGHNHEIKFSDLTVMPPHEGTRYKVTLFNTAPNAKTLIPDTNAEVGKKEIDPLKKRERARIYTKAMKQAIMKDDNKLFLRILEQGFDINAKLDFDVSLLSYATRLGADKIISTLIDKGADINAKTLGGMTPLSYACFYYNDPYGDSKDRKMYKEIALTLIKKGADTNVETDGMTPFLLARKWGDVEFALALIEEGGADINLKNQDGKTFLHEAIANGDTEIATTLIEKGADINAKDANSFTPIFYASMTGNMRVARALIEKGADINETVGDYTPLSAAKESDHKDMVSLIEQKQKELSQLQEIETRKDLLLSQRSSQTLQQPSESKKEERVEQKKDKPKV